MKTIFLFTSPLSKTSAKVLQLTLSTDLGQVEFREVCNEDGDGWLWKKYGVYGAPTLLLLDENEEELKRHTGLLSPVGLQNFVGYDPDALDDQEEESISLKEPWKETW